MKFTNLIAHIITDGTDVLAFSDVRDDKPATFLSRYEFTYTVFMWEREQLIKVDQWDTGNNTDAIIKYLEI